MRWKIAVFLLVAVFLGGVAKKTWFTESQVFDIPSGSGVSVSFEVQDVAGKAFRSKDYLGTAMIVHFWAAWCAPCLEEIPQFIEAAHFYEGKKIHWLAVSGDSTTQEARRVFPEKADRGLLRLFVDPELRLAEQLGTYQFPETYLLSREHQVVTKWVGPQDWKSSEIRLKIDQQL